MDWFDFKVHYFQINFFFFFLKKGSQEKKLIFHEGHI